MTEVNLRELDREALTDHVAAFQQSLGQDFWRLLWPAVRELATGKPVESEQLAALAGLTSIKTPHRLDMGGRTIWCGARRTLWSCR